MLLIYILLWICFYNYFLLFVAFITLLYYFVFPAILNSEFRIESLLFFFRIFHMKRLILIVCFEMWILGIFWLKHISVKDSEWMFWWILYRFSSFYISYWTWLEIHCGTTTRFSFPGEDAMRIRIVWSFVFLLFSSCFVIDL